jgi:hypothetical protein
VFWWLIMHKYLAVKLLRLGLEQGWSAGRSDRIGMVSFLKCRYYAYIYGACFCN